MTVNLPLPRRAPLGWLWLLSAALAAFLHTKWDIHVSDQELLLIFGSLILVIIYKNTFWLREADRRDGRTFWCVDKSDRVVPAKNGWYGKGSDQPFYLEKNMSFLGRAPNGSYDLMAVYRYTLEFAQDPGIEDAQAYYEWYRGVNKPYGDPPRPFAITSKQFLYYWVW